MMGGRSRRRDDGGAAAVEFALLVLPLVTLVFGMITYGYLLSFRQGMSQGASEGARAGAVWGAPYSSDQDDERITAATQQIDNALNSYGVSCADGADCDVAIGPCKVTTAPEPADLTLCVFVTVSYPYESDPLTPDLPLIPLPETLSYTASARVS